MKYVLLGFILKFVLGLFGFDKVIYNVTFYGPTPDWGDPPPENMVVMGCSFIGDTPTTSCNVDMDRLVGIPMTYTMAGGK